MMTGVVGLHPDSSYTLREFERLFSGGYGSLRDSALVGDERQTVAKGNHTLPKVFGSVKAYYDSMSLDPKKRAEGVTKGKFQLHVRMINAEEWRRIPPLDRTAAH